MFADFTYLIPEIFISVAAMVLLLAGTFREERWDANTSLITMLSIAVLLLAAFQLFQVPAGPVYAGNYFFISDVFAKFMKMLVLISAMGVLLISFDYIGQSRRLRYEFPILILLSVIGMMMMISANHFITFYMGLELQSLALYVITALRRESARASEAGLKYFILGALSSGILLYGFSLIYGFAGSLGYEELAQTLHKNAEPSMGVLFGVVLVFVGICFKLSAVPFHMWAPDVYEGAPKIVTAFFATAPKVAAMAIIIRLVTQPFSGMVQDWQQIIIVIALGSMLLGAFAALRQTNIKRLMAYSSIGHVGFMLIGVASGAVAGIQAILIYVTLYVVMSLGAFTIIVLMRRNGESLESIADLAGVSRKRPALAAVMAIFMFSMAGIPPMAGFFGKLYIFQSALQSGLYMLAVVGVLSSVVSAYYYLKIVKVMYFDAPDAEELPAIDAAVKWPTALVLAGAGGVNLLFFILPTPLIDTARVAALSLF